MTDILARPFRVLIGGFINLNVIDGSAFFLSGLTRMLAAQPHVQVSLVSANPLTKFEVVQEVLHLPNVEVVDPFAEPEQKKYSLDIAGASFMRQQYAEVVHQIYLQQNFDAVVVRDTETCFHLITLIPEIAEKLSCYVTGVTSLQEKPSPETVEQLAALRAAGVKLMAQTQAMARLIDDLDLPETADEVFILPPHVPDAEEEFETLYPHAVEPTRLVYTGKFFKAWNADKILAAFKSVKQRADSELTLEIAGDQFRESPSDPKFVANTRYLLESTPGLVWHGRVPRSISRKVISRSHVGIGWRSAELDNSAELSTKILEYGAMGIPSILNRTRLHEKLLGEDYPLFANSMADFKALLGNLTSMKEEVRTAAERCYELSRNHWYSVVLPDVMKHLGNHRVGSESQTHVIPIGQAMGERIDSELLGKKADSEIHGAVLKVVVSETGKTTVQEALSYAEFQYLSWNEATSASSEIVDAQYTSDFSDTIPSPQEPSLAEKFRDAELKAQNYKDELDVLRKKISKVKRVISRVEKSPLGPVYRRAKKIYFRLNS